MGVLDRLVLSDAAWSRMAPHSIGDEPSRGSYLAQQAIKVDGNAPESRIDSMARRLLARSLRPEESKIVQASLHELLTYYRAHAEDANLLIAVGESKPDATIEPTELAAWTMLANQLMNLDEVLNK